MPKKRKASCLEESSSSPTDTDETTSKLTLEDIPDDVIQAQVMLFLGPQDLVSTLGLTSKEYHKMATSDAVWKEFCAMRSPERSKMYQELKKKKAREKHPDKVQQEKWAVVRSWYEAFRAASQSGGALAQYNHLRTWDFWRHQNLTCLGCEEEDEIQSQGLGYVCVWPSCPCALCYTHADAASYEFCGWCGVSACDDHGDDAPLFSQFCSICLERACLDCQPVVGVRNCDLKKCRICDYSTCQRCAWKIEGDLGNGRAVRITSLDEYEALPSRDVFCKFCVEKRQGPRASKHPTGNYTDFPPTVVDALEKARQICSTTRSEELAIFDAKFNRKRFPTLGDAELEEKKKDWLRLRFNLCDGKKENYKNAIKYFFYQGRLDVIEDWDTLELEMASKAGAIRDFGFDMKNLSTFERELSELETPQELWL